MVADRSLSSWLNLSRCLRVATLPGTACLVYFAHLGLGPFGRAVLIAVMGVLVVSHLTGASARVFLRQWKVPGIRWYLIVELLLGILVPLSVFGAVMEWPNSVPAFCVIAALLFCVNGLYASLEKTLTSRVRADEKATLLSEWIGGRRPHLSFTGDDRRVEEVDYQKEAIGLLKALAYLIQPVRENAYSRMRALFLVMITCSALVAANSATANEIRELMGKDGAAQTTTTSSGGASGGTSGTTTKGESAGSANSEVEVGGLGGKESQGECELELAGAPRWARADLRELYLGEPELEATEPPGFEVGGCPGRAVVRLEGSFVYMVGHDTAGEIASIAVDSLAFGPEIFVAPAAKHVLALIEGGMEPVGGHPRLFPNGGDVVTIETPQGTIVAVRPTEHPPGRPAIATRYIELPPSVAMAWMGAMGEAERWLWPLEPQRLTGGWTYPLAESKVGQTRYRVHYDSRSGVARRDGYSYPALQTQLGYAELKGWASASEGE